MVIASVLGLGAFGLNVALNLVLLPRIGIRGASIASSVCYVALAHVVRDHRPATRGSWAGETWSRGLGSAPPGPGRRPASRASADGKRAPAPGGLVVGTLNRGGTERQILMLGSALVVRGHAVTVICINSAGDQGAAARDAGIRVVEVGFPGLRTLGAAQPVPRDPPVPCSLPGRCT